jgi:hypothetical protein
LLSGIEIKAVEEPLVVKSSERLGRGEQHMNGYLVLVRERLQSQSVISVVVRYKYRVYRAYVDICLR